MKIWAQIWQICNFGSRSSVPVNINKHVRFVLSAKFHKNRAHCNFETKSAQGFNFGSRSTISNTSMFNKLDLLCVPNFIALRIYFILGTKFSWNEGTDTYFNVECVLLGHNVYFLGGSLVVTACYIVVIASYCSLPGGY